MSFLLSSHFAAVGWKIPTLSCGNSSEGEMDGKCDKRTFTKCSWLKWGWSSTPLLSSIRSEHMRRTFKTFTTISERSERKHLVQLCRYELTPATALGCFSCPFLASLLHAELFCIKSWPQRDFGIDFWLEQADELTFGFFQTKWIWGTRREERILEETWKLLPWLIDWLIACLWFPKTGNNLWSVQMIQLTK